MKVISPCFRGKINAGAKPSVIVVFFPRGRRRHPPLKKTSEMELPKRKYFSAIFFIARTIIAITTKVVVSTILRIAVQLSLSLLPLPYQKLCHHSRLMAFCIGERAGVGKAEIYIIYICNFATECHALTRSKEFENNMNIIVKKNNTSHHFQQALRHTRHDQSQ